MKIIKKGQKEHFFVIQFQCHRCGCIFEVDDTEYASIPKNGTYYAICRCPCCDERLSKFNTAKTIKNWEDSQKTQILQPDGTILLKEACYNKNLTFDVKGD